MRKRFRSLLPFVVAGLMLVSPAPFVFGQSTTAADNNLRAEIMNNALNKKQFKNVQVAVRNGTVTLSGTVDLAEAKRQALDRVRHVKGIEAINNQIQVAGPTISDAELQQKVVKAVQYDRLGYHTTPFNAISVSVQNGVVTLGGHAYGPVDADSAVSTALNMKGVKDVVDNIQVDPVSPMDDRIRLAEYRSIYGFSSLNKYAIDPAKPIRISVQNGHVTLYGQVDSEADKNTAGIRAKTVPGVFSVTNNLQVAGQPAEK
jgi:hyperosmotically inducible periplasmic protein